MLQGRSWQLASHCCCTCGGGARGGGIRGSCEALHGKIGPQEVSRTGRLPLHCIAHVPSHPPSPPAHVVDACLRLARAPLDGCRCRSDHPLRTATGWQTCTRGNIHYISGTVHNQAGNRSPSCATQSDFTELRNLAELQNPCGPLQTVRSPPNTCSRTCAQFVLDKLHTFYGWGTRYPALLKAVSCCAQPAPARHSARRRVCIIVGLPCWH